MLCRFTMELLDFSLIISSAIFILKVRAFATGQDDSICQNVYLTASEGTITSPNYPSNFPSNLSCTWIIDVEVENCSSIEIQIADFDLHDRNNSEECHYNFQINDNIGEKQLAQFECGQKPEEDSFLTDPATSHSVSITMTSGDTIEGRGFNISYKTVQPQEEYLIFVDTRGTIVVEEQNCYSVWSLYNNTDQQLAAVQFDPSNKMFYISTTKKKVISRYQLTGWSERLRFKDDIVKDNIENVTSIVVDSVNERLYWSDASLNTISTSRLDGSERRDLFTSDLAAPSNLLLGPECRYLYWTCTHTNSAIERAFVNGTSREKAVSESSEGPFVLANAGQALYRINTRTGILRQYNLSLPFLTRASDRDMASLSFQHATSAIKTDSFLCWSADSKTYLSSLNGPKAQVYDVPEAPPSNQLLHYTTKDELSASSCAPFDEPPFIAITTDSTTKASSSTENSEEMLTSLSTYITHSAESTVLATYRSTKASTSTESSGEFKTPLSRYITHSPNSTVLASLLPRAKTSKKSEHIKTSLYTNMTKYDPKSTVVTTLFSHKDQNSVSANSRPHHANLFWHILLVLVVSLIICLVLVLASIRYKRSMSRSFHLSYPDKITFKLLEKQQSQSSSTSV